MTTSETIENHYGAAHAHLSVDEILAEMNGKKPSKKKRARAAKPQPKKLNTLEKIRLIEKTIEEDLRPVLKKHGGDLELVDVDGNNVKVKLLGSCTECGISDFTLKTLFFHVV